MGKYMKKAKITGDVTMMEMFSQSSLGVRTRAKTLALQRLQSTTPPPPPNPESSYLQLRSRRLEKVLNDPKKQPTPKDCCGQNANSSLNPSSRSSMNSGSVGFVSINCSNNENGFNGEFTRRESKEDYTEDFGIEPSFGENNLDFEGRERSTRETTPCSLIRKSDTAGTTPGSTTRRTASAATNRRIQQRNIPTTHEMEEFFACAEQQQQRHFTEKYNFDVMNDLPLSGRYEWVRV